jgi:hypothetical protein
MLVGREDHGVAVTVAQQRGEPHQLDDGDASVTTRELARRRVHPGRELVGGDVPEGARMPGRDGLAERRAVPSRAAEHAGSIHARSRFAISPR